VKRSTVKQRQGDHPDQHTISVSQRPPKTAQKRPSCPKHPMANIPPRLPRSQMPSKRQTAFVAEAGTKTRIWRNRSRRFKAAKTKETVENNKIRGTSLPVAECLCFHPCSCRRLFESLVEHMQVRTHHAQLHAPHKPTKKAWGCTCACTSPAWWCVVDLRGC
jgi:hypothetical protein